MIGAALLCAHAAFKTGCGYVGLISHQNAIIPLATKLPEAIYIGDHPKKIPVKTKAVAIGPGLGKSENSKKLLELAFKFKGHIVVDADGLNLIAGHSDLLHQLPKGSI